MSGVLDQALYDLTRGALREAFRRDPAAAIAAAGLDGAARDALLARDIEALWQAGAHPMLLLYFARACGIPASDYYARITRAEAGARRAPPTGESQREGP